MSSKKELRFKSDEKGAKPKGILKKPTHSSALANTNSRKSAHLEDTFNKQLISRLVQREVMIRQYQTPPDSEEKSRSRSSTNTHQESNSRCKLCGNPNSKATISRWNIAKRAYDILLVCGPCELEHFNNKK